MKQKRNKRLNDVLAEFKHFRNIAIINDDLVPHQTKLSSMEPSKEDFTTTLSAISCADADRLPVVGASPGSSPFSGAIFLGRSARRMFKMRCGRGNDIRCTRQLDSSWRHTLITVVPTSGELQQTKNRRPIAIVKIAYIFWPKCPMIVCSPCWKQNNQWISTDQVDEAHCLHCLR